MVTIIAGYQDWEYFIIWKILDVSEWNLTDVCSNDLYVFYIQYETS